MPLLASWALVGSNGLSWIRCDACRQARVFCMGIMGKQGVVKDEANYTRKGSGILWIMNAYVRSVHMPLGKSDRGLPGPQHLALIFHPFPDGPIVGGSQDLEKARTSSI